MDYLSSAILSYVYYNLSFEKAEAIETKAAIGLLLPILCNSKKTAFGSYSGWIADNLAATTFKASTTSAVDLIL